MRLSAKVAFSFRWNKGIENNEMCFVRSVKSAALFLKALFCGHIVSGAMIDESFLSDDGAHKNSIFSKAYKKAALASKDRDDERTVNGVLGINPKQKQKQKHKQFRMTTATPETLARYCSSTSINKLGDKQVWRLFKHACNNNMGEAACALLMTGRCDELKDFVNNDKETVLSFFTHSGILQAVKYLLDKNLADVNETVDDNHTPLIVAAKYKRHECFKALLNAGADVNKTSRNGATPLHFLACDDINLECLNLVLEAGIDINKTNVSGMPAILFSIIKGAKDCFCALLDNEGIDINAKDKNGDALLHMIGNIFYYRYFSSDMDENKGHYEDVIKMLFKSGKCAAFNEKNEDGCNTVMEHAKSRRNMIFYNMMLKCISLDDS